MTPEEQLDEARAKETLRRLVDSGQVYCHEDIAALGARLARENWTPPEPVDPDLLAFREWESAQWPAYTCTEAAYLAGARMAREQERGRANMPIGMAGALVNRCQRLLHSLPAGVHAQWDAKWGIDALCRAVEAEIAKYRGEA